MFQDPRQLSFLVLPALAIIFGAMSAWTAMGPVVVPPPTVASSTAPADEAPEVPSPNILAFDTGDGQTGDR